MGDEFEYGLAWDRACHDLVGGLAAPTTWPIAEGQALDLFFDRSDDKDAGVFERGAVSRNYRQGKCPIRAWNPETECVVSGRIHEG